MPFGLLNKNGDEVPLKAIQVQAEVNGFTAQVSIDLTYCNDGTVPLEVEFKFPLEPSAAIYEFEATINGKKITGVVQEKKKAEETYSDAIASGKGAYLLSKESDDVFAMSVGNLPPGQSVILKIGYVAELAVEDDTVVFPFSNFALNNDQYSFKAILKMAFPIRNVTSNELLKYSRDSHNYNNGVITLEKGFSNFQSVYRIQLHEPHQPCIIKEIDGFSTAYALHFAPDTEYRECEAELLFLLDRSGSMEDCIPQLRKTMYQVLKHLPQVAHFNIIGFGSNFHKLFTTSLPCVPKNIAVARRHISNMNADLGGTEMHGPLSNLLQSTSPATTERNKPQKIIFVLTDGQVNNREQVLSLVKSHAGKARVFSLGIGSDVDKELVEGLASNGGGTSLFISPNIVDEMESQVIAQLHKAVEPSYESVCLEWYNESGIIINQFIQQSPIILPPIFNHQMYTVYGMLDSTIDTLSHVVLKVSGKSGSNKYTLKNKQNEQRGKIIHRLAAHTLIRELEESRVKFPNQIVDLSTKYNIASSLTSFVIVEERQEPVFDAMNLTEMDTTSQYMTPYQTKELNALFADLAKLVQEQGELIDTIDYNVNSAQLIEAGAGVQLIKAASMQSHRKLKLILLGLILALIIIGLIIGLLLRHHK